MVKHTRLLPRIVRHAVRTPHRAARALMLRDADTWFRLQLLGVASQTRLAAALTEPSTLEELAKKTKITDHELLRAFLALGVALGEVRDRNGRYQIKGRRLRAIAGGAEDLRGLAEELVGYDAPIYTRLAEHLRGAPRRDYMAGLGDTIARASRLAEPVLVPAITAIAADRQPGRVLDVGCGTGVYLRHVLDAAPTCQVLGIDPDPDAIDVARTTLAPLAEHRWELRPIELDQLVASEPAPFDLVLLLQNIYYWPPEDRPALLIRLRGLTTPGGAAVIASAVAEGPAVNRHLDLVLRVTERNWRLPTRAEMESDLCTAGFANVDVVEPLPRSGFLVAVATGGT